MKMLLKILLVLILAGFIVGYYIKEQGEHMGEIIIGIDVLVVAFVLMPFITDIKTKI
jgi:hypothetical protein